MNAARTLIDLADSITADYGELVGDSPSTKFFVILSHDP
jgi:hypothetical protein